MLQTILGSTKTQKVDGHWTNMVHRNPLKNIFCVHLFPGKRKGFQFLILCCVSFEKIAFVWKVRMRDYKKVQSRFGVIWRSPFNFKLLGKERGPSKRKERVATVVYSDQRLGAAHYKCWSKSSFSAFFVLKSWKNKKNKKFAGKFLINKL